MRLQQASQQVYTATLVFLSLRLCGRHVLTGAPASTTPQPKLRPTGTLCWVVPDQLVVLFDPKRQRLVYVLGPEGDEEQAKQRVRGRP